MLETTVTGSVGTLMRSSLQGARLEGHKKEAAMTRRTSLIATAAAALVLAGCGGTIPISPSTTSSTPAAQVHAADSPNSFYSGNGSKSIGTLVVAHDSTIVWMNDYGTFIMHDPNFGISIASNASGGTSSIKAGTYSDVQVLAAGSWTIQVVS